MTGLTGEEREGNSLLYSLPLKTRHANPYRERYVVQLLHQPLIARLIDVVDRIAQGASRIQYLAFDVDFSIGQNVVDRAQHSRDILMNVRKAIGAGLVI